MMCQICNTEQKVFEKRVPSEVVLDREKNIVDVVLGDSIPLCSSCYFMLKPKRPVPYLWVERVLKTPHKDGRWRILDLVVLPYLVNFRKLPKEKAVEIAWKWLKLCEPHHHEIKIKPIDYRWYLYKQYDHVLAQGLMPLTFQNFKNRGLRKYAVAG